MLKGISGRGKERLEGFPPKSSALLTKITYGRKKQVMDVK